MKRTNIDFSKYELKIINNTNIKIHWLKLKDSNIYNVKFINADGVMVVTGDVGNWIFCREFWPCKDSTVSESYWVEKLEMYSSQKATVWNVEQAKSDLEELKNGREWSETTIEWFDEAIDACEDNDCFFVAVAGKHLSEIDGELLTDIGMVIDPRLEVVFDAFEEVCSREY